MATIDHSLTYKRRALKNIPHKIRLEKIIKLLDTGNKSGYNSFIDVGCSNGYITNIIKQQFDIRHTVGKDYDEGNLEIARQHYPDISFEQINLNIPLPDTNHKYDLVTCFETLEHVGNVEEAVTNLLKLKDERGNLFITVPIEIGFWGIVKFTLKRMLYKYSLEELGDVKTGNYLLSLLKGDDISVYRKSSRSGWGTHFGFDYRVVDNVLTSNGIKYKAFNAFTTRFYAIEASS